MTSLSCCFLNSLIDNPMLFAVDAEALRVECAVNIVMSIPWHVLRNVLHIEQLFVS